MKHPARRASTAYDPNTENDWRPSPDELALWRFYKVCGQTAVAVRCLTDDTLAMSAWPPEPMFAQAFMAKHGGHDMVMVTDQMDAWAEP